MTFTMFVIEFKLHLITSLVYYSIIIMFPRRFLEAQYTFYKLFQAYSHKITQASDDSTPSSQAESVLNKKVKQKL